MHQAFTSLLVMTLISHFQPGASGRNAAVLGISRLAIARTRATCAGSWSSWFFARASDSTLEYASAALLSIWAEDTRGDMLCLRSMPTEPPCVVCTLWQAHNAASATAKAARIAIFGNALMALSIMPRPRAEPRPSMSRVPRSVFFLLFTVSGFAGLIYESIWSHYLRLFLGHAAYAQTLVLALFMGGMAIGSWVCSVWSVRWKNLLRGYALAEGVIGLAALAFHGVFVAATELAYTSILPALGGELPASLFKWSLAGALILPQSVLLGMTFPLMSAGLIRRYPGAPGESLAMLYFTNSFGAAIGVLASGFVMIEWLGLPGTVQAAGVLNVALAAAVWTLARDAEPAPPRPEARSDPRIGEPYRVYLAVGLRDARIAPG